ncbi:MAG: PAS domain S-box protein [Pseudomonadota bacterium]|nr:PAS domain S-box protein [Pseudomonadota bacterium]
MAGSAAGDPRTGGLVVGIGASAGGLEAFSSFFGAMPADSGLAFVLVQHLAPDHKSMLVELLGRITTIAVVQADDGAPILPDHIYVIPPNATLTVRDRCIRIETPAPPRQHRRPIDTFFNSLAEDFGETAIGVVLAGTGSDGTLGIRAIKEAGGYTIAQAEFDHQPKSGMPQSADATGQVDEVLAVEDMAQKLMAYQRHICEVAPLKDGEGARTDAAEHLAAVTALVRTRTGHDFSHYKDRTLIRRTQRRMQVAQIDTVPAFIEYLRGQPDQVDALFREFLIGVTDFFRDPAAFQALAVALEAMLEKKPAGDPLRIWVPGCSTGEEVYSIAILVREVLERRDTGPVVQIFGTDIDDRAVALARTGRYRKAMTGVSPERLARWFVQDGDEYCPNKAIRDMCVFSPHSIIKDPPFSRLDLISCRNLMIYLDSGLQDRVMRTFHYALRPGGILFLGSSEAVTRQANWFGVIDKKQRLFVRLAGEGAGQPQYSPSIPASTAVTATATAAAQSARVRLPAAISEDRLDKIARRALERFAPVYVVIDHEDQIVRFSGGEAGRYLEPAAGAASLNLFDILKKALRPSVRIALGQTSAARRQVVLEATPIKLDGVRRAVTVIVETLATTRGKAAGGEAGAPDLRLVAFQDAGPIPDGLVDTPPYARDAAFKAQEHELSTTRTQFQGAIDDLEAANEELKSASEEYQSVNEELQSSNEELETSKEEMQSINEELQTVNAEMSSKNEQLTRLNSDLKNFLDSTQIATVFLDEAVRIKAFTPAMTDLFHLRDTDRGRPLTEIVSRLGYDDLGRDVSEVLRTLAVVEREVRIAEEDISLIMRIRPYRTVYNVIDGVVITFNDVTDRRRHEQEQARLAAIVDSSSDAIIGHSLDGRITSWNAAAQRMFGYAPSEAIGQSIAMLLPSGLKDDVPAVLKRLQSGERVEQFDIDRVGKDGKTLHLAFTISPVTNRDGVMVAASTVARDISDQQAASAHRDLLMHELSHRVKNTLATVQAIGAQTLASTPDPAEFKTAFFERIIALSETHNLLTLSDWRGAALRDILCKELAPFDSDGEPRWTLTGTDILLDSRTALALGMGVHELATNAAKYGALSTTDGHLTVKWRVDGSGERRTLNLRWVEAGGPPVQPPRRRGFGSRLIEQGLKHELGGEIRLDFLAAGVQCSISVPLGAVGQI